MARHADRRTSRIVGWVGLAVVILVCLGAITWAFTTDSDDPDQSSEAKEPKETKASPRPDTAPPKPIECVVMNLDDYGPGSLRSCVQETSVPRIVKFEVSGIINLRSPLLIESPNVTVDGASSPEGVTLTSDPEYGQRAIDITTHDVFISHLGLWSTPDAVGTPLTVYKESNGRLIITFGGSINSEVVL